jgi:hypothetical protein
VHYTAYLSLGSTFPNGRGKTRPKFQGIINHQVAFYIYFYIKVTTAIHGLTDGFWLVPGGSLGMTPAAGPANGVRSCVAAHRERVTGSGS